MSKAETNTETEEQVAAAAPPSLDDIRSAIFDAKPESRLITFFGHQIELRQPPLEQMLEARRGDQSNALLMMLVNYAFVPGTDTQVFSEADIDGLKRIPVGKDVQSAIVACNELMGLTTADINAAVKEEEKST